MSCPYSQAELEKWDGASNPMGDDCYTCTDFECEHNANIENPELVPGDREDLALFEPDAIKLQAWL